MQGSSVKIGAALVASALLSVAGIEGAQALPISDAVVAPSAISTVQYVVPRHYYHRRGSHAGLYRCGPYAQHTHLARQACR